MKSAEEWKNERWKAFETGTSLVDYYKSIQLDAFKAGMLHAAKIEYELRRKGHDHSSEWDITNAANNLKGLS